MPAIYTLIGAISADYGFEILYSVDQSQKQRAYRCQSYSAADDIDFFSNEVIEGITIAIRASNTNFLALLASAKLHLPHPHRLLILKKWKSLL